MADFEGTDEELIEFAIQESLQDSCKLPFSSTADCIEASSEDYCVIAAAIDKGDVHTLRKLWGCREAFREADSFGRLPLHRAAVLPLAHVLDQVLLASSELTLEEVTVDLETALTLAAQAGLVENVKTLLQHGASPHSTNSNNESPLLLAVKQGSYDMVDTLIMGGAFVEQVCLKKWTATHEAAKVGCTDILMLLLRQGGRVTGTDGHGVIPLGIAAEYGHPEVLDILIQHGSDVNAQARNGDTVLYDAAGSGNLDCIELLLQHGANPNIASLACQLPIHRAAYEGHYLALKTLIPVTTKRAIRLSGQSPVHSAADGGQAVCLQLLIEKGFNVNAMLETHISENYGDLRRSPLYFAVSNGDFTCSEMLLAAGAQTNLDALCCLLVAVRAERYELVRLLLSWGADVNCYFTALSDTVFPTALQYCLKDPLMLRLLLNNGYNAEKCFQCNHGRSHDMECTWGNLHNQDYNLYTQSDRISFCDVVSLNSLVHLVGGVVRMLLDYVGHVSLCPKLHPLLERQREWPDISDITGNPRALQHLCRLIIRKQMTPRRLSDPIVMATVPFPPALKNYLTYREYDLYGKSSLL
ncbi:ankyrin repeat and SOCS box protein 15-like [Hypomesus transpacificus]|uniref:ankyrin repeat and SOCS box protein 15-like n=1 Tax=Hypomesus transpacificus TaxID=137520 RepID=UPI001F07AF46|nr:ankyrin repeat and SOCS box protein 15-like [Hypomesus transpacificus]